jgi:hypothetical protein
MIDASGDGSFTELLLLVNDDVLLSEGASVSVQDSPR